VLVVEDGGKMTKLIQLFALYSDWPEFTSTLSF